MKLDPFYPIFDSSDWIARMLPLGIKLVQLRIKNSTNQMLREEITRARDLTAEAGCQLVVNDHWQLAIELGCDYVHLGQEDLDTADIVSLKKASIKIGISTHSNDELNRALQLSPDYVALGPIYPTILKKMAWQPQGLQRLAEWKKLAGHLPLVGIGGLNTDRVAGAFEAGADVVAAVTDITLNADPEARVSEWMSITSRYR